MSNKTNEKVSFSRNLACLAGKVCILLLFAGCARFKPAMKERAEQPKGVEIHTQYAVSAEPNPGYNTYEVYIANHTGKALKFTGADLNGKPLPMVHSEKMRKLLTVDFGDGDEIQLTEPGLPEDSPVTWWQFYPSAEVGSGETIALQINFKAIATGRQSLRLLASSAIGNIEHVVPRFWQPEQRLTAITYSQDGRRMFVQYASRKVDISGLSVNGESVRGFRILRSLGGDTPDMAAFDAPFALRNGQLLHVRAEFADGSRRDALVRVLLGIVLDGGFDANRRRESAIRREYGLDKKPAVEMLPFDVACGDAKAGKNGMYAPAVTEKRRERYGQERGCLAGINYCAAFHPGIGNIYGQICDAIYAKPYQLGWGRQAARFIEAEERRAKEEGQTARPRPWLWVPERFNRSGRYVAAGEQELLAWLMPALGCKGIRYHYWRKAEEIIQEEHPWLLAGLAKLNKDIAAQKEIFSPLVWVSEKVFEKEKIKIYESWSGDQGILIFVRNLDYRTAMPGAGEREPIFRVEPKSEVELAVELPEWFKGRKAADLLSGQSLASERRGNAIRIMLDQLDAFRLIWLE